MAWDFETDAEYQVLLDWTADFVEKKVAPLDMVLGSAMEYQDPDFIRLVRPLQQEVKDMGLWACHLGPELGGLGFGQLKLALLNEILGQSRFASVVFGCQAPDTGNAEILAHYGSARDQSEIFTTLAERRAGVELFDERAPGWGRPHSVSMYGR